MTPITTYKLFHWWAGDRVSDPGWVQSATNGELYSLEQVAELITEMRHQGWDDFRVYRHTLEHIALKDIEALCPATAKSTQATGKHSQRKSKPKQSGHAFNAVDHAAEEPSPGTS